MERSVRVTSKPTTDERNPFAQFVSDFGGAWFLARWSWRSRVLLVTNSFRDRADSATLSMIDAVVFDSKSRIVLLRSSRCHELYDPQQVINECTSDRIPKNFVSASSEPHIYRSSVMLSASGVAFAIPYIESA